MAELLKYLSTNSQAALAILIVGLVLVITISVLYAVAFAQGRSVSFWPPSIGERPASGGAGKPDAEKTSSPPDPKAAPAVGQNPVVDRGTVLEGASGKSYRILSAIYGGSSATLFKAQGPENSTVIAKLFWRGLSPNSAAWELFQREQRMSEILQHRNIVRSLDRGLRSGYPFTIIEYLAGGTLRDWLETHDRIPGPDMLSIASQLADAIDYAHSRGVIHRDIKPGNVLFDSDAQGRIALNDFGIAAIMGAFEYAITAVGGEFNGSPGYISPELIQGSPATAQADVYSFAVVLYEMIAKRLPFEGEREVWAILRAKVTGDAPDIRQFRPNTDQRISERLAQALSRDPSERPATTRAVLAGIEDAIRLL